MGHAQHEADAQDDDNGKARGRTTLERNDGAAVTVSEPDDEATDAQAAGREATVGKEDGR